ncbi:MAG: substrate-binding domain-containing protein, partial [Chloroflexota bacterium]|nr:substrate-binding domain-containing protein [Chloroflexota bacterium]
RYLRELSARRVDGVVLVAPKLEHDPRVGEVLRGSLPAVSTHHVAGGGVPIVRPDDERAAYLATRHLLALGHRRVGTITGDAARRVSQVRVDGYRRALAEAGVAFDPNLIEEGDWEPDGGCQAAHRLLDRVPDLSAVFVQNDPMAVGVLAALHDRGRRVPQECAVVGCDDLTLSGRTIPPLSTVHIPFFETGEAAARLLLGMIADGSARRSPPPEPPPMPVHLVYRASCGAPTGDRSGAGMNGHGAGCRRPPTLGREPAGAEEKPHGGAGGAALRSER